MQVARRAGHPAGRSICRQRCWSVWYILDVWIEWAEEDAQHIATRAQRYPDALDLAVEWTQEAVNDERAVLIDPYPRSRVGAAAIVGFSPSAGRALVVLAHLGVDGRWHGRTAWPATGRDLALYEEGLGNDQE